MNALESRKQLLIAESNLNRARLVAELAAVTAGVRALKDRAQSLRSIASSAAVLLAALAALQRRKPAVPDAKASWLRSLLRGAGLVSNLWLALRSPRGGHAGE